MDRLAIQQKPASRESTLTLRDAVAPLFRQRRIAIVVFCGILGGALLAAVLVPSKYESEMKILVNRDRADDVVTPNADPRIVPGQAATVTDADLNSEVELLKSHDLLEQVVLACGLESQRKGFWGGILAKLDALHGSEAKQRQIARAVETLESRLSVEPLKKTSLIRASYSSTNPQLAARVLQTLADLYQEKHAEVQRPAGTFDFFEREADYYESELAAREARLLHFDAANGLIDATTQKQLALQQISQLEIKLEQDRASTLAAQDRIRELKAEQSAFPQRQTTVMRKSDNGELLAQLNSTLLSLELKQREMLAKYAPDYPLVVEVNAQVADARRALADAQRQPIEEITTDRTPAQDWMATEITKAETDRAAMIAQAASIEEDLRESREMALKLGRESAEQEDLARDVKTSEQNYVLYLGKQEEARISDLLDRKRIVNVSIAEKATVPAFPTRSWAWILTLGLFSASAVGAGAAYAADRFDPMFRTPEELGRYLDLKVLAAIPAKALKQ
jgi:uncharacterized protein involved in exopolysaccharide biosynthesis